MVREVVDLKTGIKTIEITDATLTGNFINKQWIMAIDDGVEGIRTGQFTIVNAKEIKTKEIWNE